MLNFIPEWICGADSDVDKGNSCVEAERFVPDDVEVGTVGCEVSKGVGGEAGAKGLRCGWRQGKWGR